MDCDLVRRFEVFEQTGQVDADICAFGRAEVSRLEAGGARVGEETAGVLVSHLLLALQRVRRGQPVGELPAAERIEAELSGYPDAVAAAEALADRARVRLAVMLPHEEVRFVALHLAVLAGRSARDAKGEPR